MGILNVVMYNPVIVKRDTPYEPKVKRIMPGDNPGITVLVLKELY